MRTIHKCFWILAVVAVSVWSCSPSDDGAKSGEEGSKAEAPAANTGGEPTGTAAPGEAGSPTTAKENDPGSAPSAKPVTPGEKLAVLTPWRQTGDDAAVEGSVKTASGLEYVVLKEGEGAPPPAAASIKIHATGWLRNGDKVGAEVWDTRSAGTPEAYSLRTGQLSPTSQPASLKESGPPVIAAWYEALREMKKGERRWLLVPSTLAYGQRGYGTIIRPNADLIFDIELVDFVQ